MERPTVLGNYAAMIIQEQTMNSLKLYAAIATLLAAGSVFAQAEQTPPMPSTSPTEGTAADRTPPGSTPTRDPSTADPAAPGQMTHPQPSTNEAEGTAADRTPPGQTSTRAQAPGGMTASGSIVGAKVVGSSDEALGTVVETVNDGQGQPAFVVIQSKNNMHAVPYSTAASMMNGEKIVIDQSRLSRAPTVKQGEWRDRSSKTWQSDAQRYWDKG